MYHAVKHKISSHILNMKLKYKLILTYILVSIIPLTIMGVLNIAYVQNNIYLMQKQNIDDTLGKLDLELNAKIDTINQTFLYIALNSKTQYILSNTSALNDDMSLYVELLYKDFDPLIETICGLDSTIKSIKTYSVYTLPNHEPFLYGKEKLTQTDWYPFADSFKAFQPNIFSFNDDLEIVYRINSKYSQELLGYLAVTISKKDFFPVSIISADPHTDFEIRNDSSAVLYAPSGISRNSINATLHHQKTGMVITMYQTNNYFTTHSYIGIFLIIIVCILISCLLVLLVSLIFSKKMTRRIDRLLEEMETVSKGMLDITIKADSSDEIGRLTERFSQLVAQLKQVFKDMYQAELQAKNSEMAALQAQINPHFLYNTLNMIQWKAIDANSWEICDIIQNLSTFYRTSLNSGRNTITIGGELDNLKSYLSLQQLMQPDKFEVQYDIDPALLEYKIIKFILQPVAENSLEHGFAVYTSQKGLLLIKVAMDNNDLSFTIKDNGTGMNSSQLEELQNFSSSGYGLKNIRERLEIAYGSNYEFTIDSVPFQGTTVKIIIPIP